MQKFFAAWRRWSDRLTDALVVACGVACLVGAWQGYQFEVPFAVLAAWVGFGLLLLAAVGLRKLRRR